MRYISPLASTPPHLLSEIPGMTAPVRFHEALAERYTLECKIAVATPNNGMRSFVLREPERDSCVMDQGRK